VGYRQYIYGRRKDSVPRVFHTNQRVISPWARVHTEEDGAGAGAGVLVQPGGDVCGAECRGRGMQRASRARVKSAVLSSN
jgi:hypothetical protein